MLPHITEQSVFVVHHSVAQLAADADHFNHLSCAPLKRGMHDLGPNLRRIMLHTTVLSMTVVATAIGAIAD